MKKPTFDEMIAAQLAAIRFYEERVATTGLLLDREKKDEKGIIARSWRDARLVASNARSRFLDEITCRAGRKYPAGAAGPGERARPVRSGSRSERTDCPWARREALK